MLIMSDSSQHKGVPTVNKFHLLLRFCCKFAVICEVALFHGNNVIFVYVTFLGASPLQCIDTAFATYHR